MKALLYCTKNAPYLVHERGWCDCDDMSCSYDCYSVVNKQFLIDEDAEALNGTIPCECDYEIEEIRMLEDCNMTFLTQTLSEEELLKKSCLEGYELGNYLGDNAFRHINGKAIHIKNLHTFDEPKDLSEYSKNVEHCKCDECLENCKKYCKYYYAKNNITQTINTGCIKYAPLYKAPQNMMYVFDGEEKKVLISIHPEHLCKILNGEKTIEVRKKTLKYM